MIEKKKFHVLNYVKKEEYCASMDGMRYMLRKGERDGEPVLEVIIWPEPYCYAKTEEEKKQRREFALSAEGVEQAADWLNEQYQEQKPLWELAGRACRTESSDSSAHAIRNPALRTPELALQADCS